MTSQRPGSRIALADEVSDALAAGRGVVALESTIISHGLPSASSADTARRIADAVRRGGAVPATIALVAGTVRIGLSDEELLEVAEGADVVKTSVRDLGSVLSSGATGATTVAATAYLAHRCGIRVFATGGLGGVHRGAGRSYDESADLAALASVPVTVVSAGVKSILDIAATLERLESLSVPVVGFGTDAMPGFYVRDTGLSVPWRVDTPEQVAELMGARDDLGLPQSLVVAQPVPPDAEMDRALHDRVLEQGLAEAERRRITGKQVTPFLLGWFHEHTEGASLAANVALILANAELAGRIAAVRER